MASILIKGFFFQMVHGLLKEFNPEIAQKVEEKLTSNINEVKANKWYPVDDMYKYIDFLSGPALLAISKRVYPVINEQTPLMKDCKTPLDIIKMMNQITPFTVKGDPLPQYNLVESEENYAKVESLYSLWRNYPTIEEGFFHGICNIFKFSRVHVKYNDDDAKNSRLFEIKWQ